jgi:transcriptional regulator with XRE-family HTH domain
MLVQKLRLKHGWSQEQLADLSGVSVRTVQRIERGQAASVETLKALGAVFGVDFSTLKEQEMTLSPEPVAGAVGSQSPAMTNEEALALAYVRNVKGFYIHLVQFVAVNAVLVVINLVTYPRFFWAAFPIVGWGVGLLVHGLKVFDKIPLLTADWERRVVERRLGRKL